MMVWFRWFSSSTGPVFSGEPAVNLPGCKEIRVDNCFSFSSSPLLKVGGMQLTYPKFRSPGFFWLWPVLFGGFKWPFLCWWPAFGRWKGLLEKACMFFFQNSQLLAIHTPWVVDWKRGTFGRHFPLPAKWRGKLWRWCPGVFQVEGWKNQLSASVTQPWHRKKNQKILRNWWRESPTFKPPKNFRSRNLWWSKKSREKTTADLKNLVGWLRLVDRHKRLGSTPPTEQDAGCNHGKFWRLFCRKFPSLKMGNVILVVTVIACFICMFHGG